MKHRRYGKFDARNYILALSEAGCLSFLAVAGIIQGYGFLRCAYMIVLCIIYLFLIMQPYCEWFAIRNGSIISYRHRGVSEILIPPECTLIITHASIRDPFSIQAFPLKNKYAISILSQMPLEKVLRTLHAYRATKYTNSTIENNFTNMFVYSFMFREEVFTKIVEQGVSRIIIPESLVKQFDVGKIKCEVYIDYGY